MHLNLPDRNRADKVIISACMSCIPPDGKLSPVSQSTPDPSLSGRNDYGHKSAEYGQSRPRFRTSMSPST